jgi:hypothetical protein
MPRRGTLIDTRLRCSGERKRGGGVDPLVGCNTLCTRQLRAFGLRRHRATTAEADKEFAGASRPEPPTTPADFESVRAYAAYLSRIMEMPVPLDEVVATVQLDQRGHVVGPAPKGDVSTQMLSSIDSPDYARIQAPMLALYANADYWPSDKAAVFAREREQLARALPRAARHCLISSPTAKRRFEGVRAHSQPQLNTASIHV